MPTFHILFYFPVPDPSTSLWLANSTASISCQKDYCITKQQLRDMDLLDEQGKDSWWLYRKNSNLINQKWLSNEMPEPSKDWTSSNEAWLLGSSKSTTGSHNSNLSDWIKKPETHEEVIVSVLGTLDTLMKTSGEDWLAESSAQSKLTSPMIDTATSLNDSWISNPRATTGEPSGWVDYDEMNNMQVPSWVKTQSVQDWLRVDDSDSSDSDDDDATEESSIVILDENELEDGDSYFMEKGNNFWLI